MDTPQASALQQRTSQRTRDMLLVSYTIDPEHAPEYTETYDIAIGGLAMLTIARIEPNTSLTVELELRGDPRPKLRLNANVRWSTFDPLTNKYRTGVAFVDGTPELEAGLIRYIDTLHQLRDFGAT